MHCLSRVQELLSRVDTVQEPRREELLVLPKPPQRDLRRIPGPVRERLPGAHVLREVRGKIRAFQNETAVNATSTMKKSPGCAKRPRRRPTPVRRARFAGRAASPRQIGEKLRT